MGSCDADVDVAVSCDAAVLLSCDDVSCDVDVLMSCDAATHRSNKLNQRSCDGM